MMTLNDMDKTFLRTVGYGNASEVASGKMALQKSQNADVRMVAETLVKEHGEAQMALIAVGKNVNFAVPEVPDAKHKKAAANMERMSGAAFNKAFIKAQIADHQATIALFEKTIAANGNPEVKAFAEKYLPAIKEHTKMIYQAATSLGIPNPGNTGDGPPAKS